MKNARFWIWHNDGWVKLTLTPGESARFGTGGSHEEGYHCEDWCYEYDAEGQSVVCHSVAWGRDCDGPYRRFAKSYCPLTELKSRSMFEECGRLFWCPFYEMDLVMPSSSDYGIYCPEWRKESSFQRDYYAEAMGY